MEQTHGGAGVVLSQLRCHSMGPQPPLCFLPSPGWFLVTMLPLAKTMATAWLGSPDMREAAATCEIRTWYHLSGSCESTQGGQRQHQLLGREDGRQWGGMGLSAPVAGRGTCTLRWVLVIICLFHAPHTELVGPGGPSSSPQSWWGSVHSFGYPGMPCTKGTFGASLRAEPDRAAGAAPGCGTQG